MHFMCLWFGKSDITHYFWDIDRNEMAGRGFEYLISLNWNENNQMLMALLY